MIRVSDWIKYYLVVFYWYFFLIFLLLHYNVYHILLSNTLAFNQLTGSIPSEIGLLTSLKVIYLGKWLNQLLCCCLLWFFILVFSPCHFNVYHVLLSNTLGGNDLTGSIPSEIEFLTSLETIYIGKWLNRIKYYWVALECYLYCFLTFLL